MVELSNSQRQLTFLLVQGVFALRFLRVADMLIAKRS